MDPTQQPQQPPIQTETPPVQPPEQPVPAPIDSQPMQTAAIPASPIQAAPVSGNVDPSVAADAKFAGLMSIIVAALNGLALVVLLAIGVELVIPIAVILLLLLVGLGYFGSQLRQAAAKDYPTIKKLILTRIYPIMGVMILLNLIGGGGGVGILPLLILFGGTRALSKIKKIEKGEPIK